MIAVKVSALTVIAPAGMLTIDIQKRTQAYLCNGFAAHCCFCSFVSLAFLQQTTITAICTVNFILSFFLLPLYLDYLRAATLVNVIIIITVIMRVLTFCLQHCFAYLPIVTVVSLRCQTLNLPFFFALFLHCFYLVGLAVKR